MEIIVDITLIITSIVLLSDVQDEFYRVLDHGGHVYVARDLNYLGPVQIVCIHSAPKHNCNEALSDDTPFTSTQNYFSLKYLELFRGDTQITVRDIIDGRYNLFIVLAIYIVIWFCISCAGKLQSIGLNRQHRDYQDSLTPHWTYFFCTF